MVFADMSVQENLEMGAFLRKDDGISDKMVILRSFMVIHESLQLFPE